MAAPRDLILQLLITARNQASGVLDGLRTRIGQIGVAAASAARGGIAALGAALAVGFKSGLDNAAEFETILLRIKAAGVGSQAELNRLADAAKRLGAESGAGPTQVALALENLVKAGLSADEALAALPDVINLAQGQMLGLAEASDLVVKTVNQFGLRFSDSQRVVDLFATAANAAATSVQDLRQGLENSALAARSNGLSLQQTLAALNTLIQNGQPAAEAGEALQNMLLELGDASSQAREQLRASSVVTGDFSTVLNLLAQGGPQASSVLGAFSETAQTAAGILSNSQPFYREQVRQLTAIGVSAADAAKIMGGSFENSLSQLQATFSEFWQTLAEPALPALTELFKESTRFINENRQALSDWITTGLSPLTGTIDLVRYGWAQYNGEAEKAAQISQAMNERLAAIGRALSGTSNDYRKAATQAQDLATAQQRVTGAVTDQATVLTAIADAIATYNERAREAGEGSDLQRYYLEQARLEQARYNQELAKTQPVTQQAHQAQQAAKQTLEELGVAYRIAEAQAARLREQVAAGQATTQEEAAARGAAVRALGDYASAAQGVVAAAQRQIDLTAAETETLNQNQTARRAQQEAILQLAQARGDENAAAQASADLARLEVQSAREIADAKTRQVTQAAQLLIAKRQEYEFTLQSNVAQQQEIALLEQTVQQKLAEANAARSIIPLREQEAAQAARMAGPIGALLRLTEQRVAAAGREIAAIERGYDAQIREQQVIEAVANAKGDAAAAAAAAVRIKELEAEKAQAVADALAREAEAAIAAAEAKKLEILASDRSIEAKNTEIAALDALIAKQRDSVAAAQASAAAASAQADAAAKSAAAATDASAAIRETGDVTERSGNQAAEYSEALVYLAKHFDQLSERGKAALDAIGKGPDFDVSGAGIMSAWRYLELITQATQKLDEAAGAEIAFNRRLQETAALANGVGEEADRAREQLVRMAQTGSIGIQGLTQDGEQAIQMLEDIRNASLEAEAALSGMAEDFERQILQLRGDQRALLEREHQDNLRRIEEEYAKAGALGRDEYAAAKRRAEDLHKLKLRQLEEQDRQSRTRPPTGGETASAGGTGAGGGAMTINNMFLIDPTKLTSEEWVRRNVLPTVDKVSRLRG